MSTADDLIVSVSGIRGIIGRSLTPATALAFASALGMHVHGGRVVVSRDGRPSGRMLGHAILAGLTAAGCEVHDLDVAPTPTVGLAVRSLQAAGGVQITASHNPVEWNGLKLFGPDGRVLSAAEGRKVQALFETGAGASVPWDRVGNVQDYRKAEDVHRERVLELVDVEAIRAAELTAFLDANGGAGGPLGRALLKSLQVKTVCAGCIPDGVFLHEPEPTEANLREIGPQVQHYGRTSASRLDPDADRLAALIDETGRYIGEELTLALAAWFRLSRERGPVVVNMSTSRVVEDVAARFGCPFHRSAVGEANVADKMLEVSALIGGEGNGGVIDPRVGWVRDPFIGMGLILNLLAESGKKLSEVVAELPAYHIVKDKYTVTRERLPRLFAAAWRSVGRRHGQTTRTVCDWTGPTAGCTFGRATPSRLCASPSRERRRERE